MGLFENIGRKVETFKQQAQEASEEEAPYKCANCGELIYTERDDCPECGSEQVFPRTIKDDETAEETTEAPEEETRDSSPDDTDRETAADIDEEKVSEQTADKTGEETAEKPDEKTADERSRT